MTNLSVEWSPDSRQVTQLTFLQFHTMISITLSIVLYVQFSAMAGSFASATPSRYQLARRASPDNTVVVYSAQDYWCNFSFPH